MIIWETVLVTWTRDDSKLKSIGSAEICLKGTTTRPVDQQNMALFLVISGGANF